MATLRLIRDLALRSSGTSCRLRSPWSRRRWQGTLSAWRGCSPCRERTDPLPCTVFQKRHVYLSGTCPQELKTHFILQPTQNIELDFLYPSEDDSSARRQGWRPSNYKFRPCRRQKWSSADRFLQAFGRPGSEIAAAIHRSWSTCRWQAHLKHASKFQTEI